MLLNTINQGPKAVGNRPVEFVRTQKSAEEYFAEQMGWDKPEKPVLINMADRLNKKEVSKNKALALLTTVSILTQVIITLL